MIKHPGKTDVVEIRDRILDKGVTVRRVRDPNDSGAPAASAVGAGELSSPSERAAFRIVQKAFDAWNDHDVEGCTALLDQGYVGEMHQTASALRGSRGCPSRHAEHSRVPPRPSVDDRERADRRR